ncbi:MAG TPA: ABC transporter ATP-binding protein [Gaiellaceae bacterium]|nr:ABC transporter ATP-binding protein [Gaiellaceae bacterium]
MEALRVAIDVPRRAFRVALELAVGRETVALVGPSGAGKTTVLRAISGLTRPERGRIELDGAVLFDSAAGVDVPPERRRVGFVFQDYALFPHMTVEQNVRYAGRDRAGELLDRLGIAHLAHARPGSLSGGERQRVGLARALARDPEVLLLDEPLSALDAHTRMTVRAELRELLEGFGLPALLVTHDYEDAAALATRIGVLVEGRLLQLGTPAELIAAPADPFVASFTGGNLMRGRARAGAGGLTEVILEDGSTLVSADEAYGEVGVIVYPWDVSISREPIAGSALNHVERPVTSIVPVGNRVRVRVGLLSAELTALSAGHLSLQPGDTVHATFKATATRLVPMS